MSEYMSSTHKLFRFLLSSLSLPPIPSQLTDVKCSSFVQIYCTVWQTVLFTYEAGLFKKKQLFFTQASRQASVYGLRVFF